MKNKILKLLSLAIVFIMAFSILPIPLVKADTTITQGDYTAAQTLNQYYDKYGIERITPLGNTPTIANKTVKSFGFQLWKSGSPTGNIEYEIRNNVPDSGSGLGNLIFSQVVTTAESLDGTPTWYDVTVSPTVFIPDGTSDNYSIGIHYEGQNSSTNVIYTRYKSGADVYDGASSYVYHTSWSNQLWGSGIFTLDMMFRLTYQDAGFAVSNAGSAYNVITNSQDIQGNIDALNSGNATIRGFDIGLVTGNYTTQLVESGNYGIGLFTLSSDNFTGGVTYFWRTKAYNVIDGWAYSNVEDSFIYSPIEIPTLSMYFGEVQSDRSLYVVGSVDDVGSANITQRGFRVSSDNISWNLPAFDTFPPFFNPVNNATDGSGLYTFRSSADYPYSANYYVAAYATNGVSWGYSDTIKITNNITTSTNITGFSFSGQFATVINDRVQFGITINNVSPFPITQAIFSVSQSSDMSNPMGTTFVGTNIKGLLTWEVTLSPTTLYYWQVKVYIDSQWKYSDIFQVTTGSLPSIVYISPDVRTDAPTVINRNGFQAHATVINVGSEPLEWMGFEWSLNGIDSNGDLQVALISGNVSYSGAVSGFNTPNHVQTEIVYYRAKVYWEISAIGTGYGQWIQVNLFRGTYSGGGSGSVIDLAYLVKHLAQVQGMDNSFGHWAFMLEVMIVILFIFGTIMIILATQHAEATTIKIVAIILGVAELIVFGAFVFTGWLGIWPIIFLGIGVVVVIIIFFSIFTSKGG